MKKLLLGFAIAIAVYGFAPFVPSLFHINLLTEIFILAIFALSLNILVGYTGLISLGHAAFFGVGGYTAALVAQNFTSNLLVTLGFALVISFIFAIVVGIFCVRVNGFYFLMLTLAFSQMVYSFIHQSTNLTGGSNGLSGIPNPTIAGFQFSNDVFIFYLVVSLFLVLFAILRVIVQSPFGQVLVGIRENETRVKSMGYNTSLYKYSAFLIAGGLAGVAGALYTYFNGFIAPTNVYWTMSGSALFMVLIGGAGTLLGPILGSALIVWLETIVSSYTDAWMLIMGAIFIIFVIFFPKGIVGIGQSLYRIISDKVKRKDSIKSKATSNASEPLPTKVQE